MHMKEILVSIVMPVYNTGIYLEEALKTIFSQNFQQFELICVDDASDDMLTRKVLKTFQTLYRNMRVIRLENSVGAAGARNVGFSKVEGKYVIFLDSDDLFVEDMLEKMYGCICEGYSDVCVCGFEEFFTKGGKKYFCSKYLPDEQRVNCVDREEWLFYQYTSPWNKLCRTQFLRDNKIYFQSLKSCNDVFFSCMIMIKAKKRCYIKDKPLIFYRTRTGTQISAQCNPEDLCKAIQLVYAVGKQSMDRDLLLRWTSVLLLGNGIRAMKVCNDIILNAGFYKMMHAFFAANPVRLQNMLLDSCVENILRQSHSHEWIYGCLEPLGQLRLSAGKIKKEIGSDRKIILWGLGKRGRIIQQFFREENIYLQGVTDIKNQNVGGRTEFGNKIFDTEYALHNGGLIVASNKSIVYFLKNRDLKILDIEKYLFF